MSASLSEWLAFIERQHPNSIDMGLDRVRERALKSPYRIGTPFVWCSTNDVIAFATQARLYERMTGDPQFRTLATEARDWIFGRNPWGISFVIGVPEGGRFASRPHHMFWERIDHLPVGGLVDGPVSRSSSRSSRLRNAVGLPWGSVRMTG